MDTSIKNGEFTINGQFNDAKNFSGVMVKVIIGSKFAYVKKTMR